MPESLFFKRMNQFFQKETGRNGKKLRSLGKRGNGAGKTAGTAGTAPALGMGRVSKFADRQIGVPPLLDAGIAVFGAF